MLTERHWCCVSVNHFIQEENSAKWINKEVSCLAFCFATTGDSTRFFAYLRSHFVCEKVLADASFMFGLLLCSFACWRFSKNALYQRLLTSQCPDRTAGPVCTEAVVEMFCVRVFVRILLLVFTTAFGLKLWHLCLHPRTTPVLSVFRVSAVSLPSRSCMICHRVW